MSNVFVSQLQLWSSVQPFINFWIQLKKSMVKNCNTNCIYQIGSLIVNTCASFFVAVHSSRLNGEESVRRVSVSQFPIVLYFWTWNFERWLFKKRNILSKYLVLGCKYFYNSFSQFQNLKKKRLLQSLIKYIGNSNREMFYIMAVSLNYGWRTKPWCSHIKTDTIVLLLYRNFWPQNGSKPFHSFQRDFESLFSSIVHKNDYKHCTFYR